MGKRQIRNIIIDSNEKNQIKYFKMNNIWKEGLCFVVTYEAFGLLQKTFFNIKNIIKLNSDDAILRNSLNFELRIPLKNLPL